MNLDNGYTGNAFQSIDDYNETIINFESLAEKIKGEKPLNSREFVYLVKNATFDWDDQFLQIRFNGYRFHFGSAPIFTHYDPKITDVNLALCRVTGINRVLKLYDKYFGL